MKRNVRAMSDWLVKAHYSASDDPSQNAFVGQISARPDHWYFGRPEHSRVNRVVYSASSSNPGSDLAAEYAAGFAAAAVLFRQEGDQGYADLLFRRAKQAFGFAKRYQVNWKTPDGVFQAYKSYWPQGYLGQMAWGAAWMCKYDRSWCGEASDWWNQCMNVNNIRYALGYDWDTVLPGAAAVLVTSNVPGVSDAAKGWLEGYILSKWEDTSSRCPKEAYANVCYTNKGLAYYADWGTLRGTANAAFIATLMGKHGGGYRDGHVCWARSQLQYMLGTGQGNDASYVIGYGGRQAATRPHHRGAACARGYSSPTIPYNNGTCSAGERDGSSQPCCDVNNFMADRDSPIMLKGALVGGPDQNDYYPNERNDYKRSEVAIDYQAGFTGAAAALASFDGSARLLDRKCGAVAKRGAPKRVADYALCGGEGGACPADLRGQCADEPWPGYACQPGQKCERRSQFAWVCVSAVPNT